MTSRTSLRLRCQACGADVNGSRKAAVHIRTADTLRVQDAQQEWDRAHEPGPGSSLRVLTRTDLLSYPEPANWLLHCDQCNPHKDENGTMCAGCYWFSLDRCKTSTDLLFWTAHLMGKDWLAATDWDRFIRAAAQSTGRVDP